MTEEKRVKQIDFNKPLQTTVAGYPARVVREGMTLVEYETDQGNTQRVVVDETGMVYAKERARQLGSHHFQIENKPEEPKDHLVLWKMDNGKWRIDSGTAYTKSRAEEVSKIWVGQYGNASVIVKVPS